MFQHVYARQVFVVAVVTQFLSPSQLFLGCLIQGDKVESGSPRSS